MTDASCADASYTIVAAAPRHLSGIPKIEQAAAALFAEEDLPRVLRYRVTDFDVLRRARRNGRLWVALDKAGHPVGFALAEVMDGQAYLSEVDVHPRHARQGLGKRLVRTVVHWARRLDYDSVSLVTFRHLAWNAPFYRKLGFVQLADEEMGQELREHLEEEGKAGIDIGNRIGMRLTLRRKSMQRAGLP